MVPSSFNILLLLYYRGGQCHDPIHNEFHVIEIFKTAHYHSVMKSECLLLIRINYGIYIRIYRSKRSKYCVL